MSLWTLKGYVTNRGENIVKEWCTGVDDGVWAAFAFHMDYLCGQAADKWGRPWAEKLHGGTRQSRKGCSGLVEIIFEVSNIQYRPLGFFSGEMEFTILFFALEVNDKFVPPTACEIAKTNRAVVEMDRSRAREFIIE